MATQIAATAATAAMSVTHGQFQAAEVSGLKRKLNDAVLEMERARMIAEDARGQENEKRQRIISDDMNPAVNLATPTRAFLQSSTASVDARLFAATETLSDAEQILSGDILASTLFNEGGDFP